MSFEWRRGQNQLYAGEELIGELCVDLPDKAVIEDSAVDQIKPGVFRIDLSVLVKEPVEQFRLVLEFKAHYQADWAMIPAVSYNGNHWGRGNEPKGFTKDGIPWAFSYSRASVPGATYSEGSRWAVGLFGDLRASDAPFSCSLLPEQEQVVHRLIWPEEESPDTYYMKNRYQEGFQRQISLDAGARFKAGAYLVAAEVRTPKLSYGHLLDFAWEVNYHRQKPWYSRKSCGA